MILPDLLVAAVFFALGWVAKGDALWNVVEAARYWQGEALAAERDLAARRRPGAPWTPRRRPALAEPWPLRAARGLLWPGHPRGAT